MSNTHVIKIIKGYSNGELKLAPRHTYAKNKDYIRWIIKSDDVSSIESMKMKNDTEIFKVLPHPDGSSTDWIAEIKEDLPCETEYEYSISWNGKFGKKETDPKITVNPTGFNFLRFLIGFILSLILAIFSIKFLNKQRSRK